MVQGPQGPVPARLVGCLQLGTVWDIGLVRRAACPRLDDDGPPCTPEGVQPAVIVGTTCYRGALSCAYVIPAQRCE